MLIKARPLRRSCTIVESKYVLMSFSFEKLRSAEATVTGRVNATLRATQRFGYTSWRQISWRNVSNSKAVVCGDSWFPEPSQVHQYQNILSQSVSSALQCILFVSPHWTCSALSWNQAALQTCLWPGSWSQNAPAVTSMLSPQHYWKMLPQAFEGITEGLVSSLVCKLPFCVPEPFLLELWLYVHGLTKLLGSWHCLGKSRMPVSGEGGFGIVNEPDSNVKLHWTSLQKLVYLVSGRKNFTPDNRTDQKSKRCHLFCQGLSLYFCDWVIDCLANLDERISDFFNLASGSSHHSMISQSGWRVFSRCSIAV